MTKYLDANFVNYLNSGKFTSSFFLLTNKVISWKSSKQYIIALSIMEPKFMTWFEPKNQVLWFQIFISRLNVIDSIVKLLNIFCDNIIVVLFFNNDKYLSRFKYIKIKHLVVRERV